MSAKNELQEYCQRHKQSLPVYNTARLPNCPAHEPSFQSTVLVAECQYSGGVAGNKVASEQSAASTALKAIAAAPQHTSPGYQRPDRFDTILFLDAENVPLPPGARFVENCWAIGVLSKCHHLAQSVQLSAALDMRVIDSAVADAADHMLSFEAGRMSLALTSRGTRAVFYIVSRDHAAEATTVALQQADHEAHHCTSVPAHLLQ